MSQDTQYSTKLLIFSIKLLPDDFVLVFSHVALFAFLASISLFSSIHSQKLSPLTKIFNMFCVFASKLNTLKKTIKFYKYTLRDEGKRSVLFNFGVTVRTTISEKVI